MYIVYCIVITTACSIVIDGSPSICYHRLVKTRGVVQCEYKKPIALHPHVTADPDACDCIGVKACLACPIRLLRPMGEGLAVD